MFRYVCLIVVLLIGTSIACANNDSFIFPGREFSIGFYNKSVLPNSGIPLPHPLFWKSRAKVDNGLTFSYEYLVFHTKKYFSVNFDNSLSWWEIQSQSQVALSFFFVLRFWLFRMDSFNPYIAWSIAGPTLLSRRTFDNANLGGHFIFQDFLGIGVVIGRNHHVDISLKMYHYSNGDLFLNNAGFDVPTVLTVGYIFKPI